MRPRPGEARPTPHTWVMIGVLTAIIATLVFLFVTGRSALQGGGGLAGALPGRRQPDELPVMLNRDPPFRYPAPLYARKIQGNVTLRLFIDRDGRIRPESTRVQESSGYASFDSSAVTGSQDLRFMPAKLNGEPMAVSILFPVFFRHPEASPLPGDTVLRRPR
jgi:TonB family protein